MKLTRIIVAVFFLIALSISPAQAALRFPDLTGRVVDDAHILSSQEKDSLEETLKGFEERTHHQLVVATLATLQGDTIEDYGYQLGRHWGIGVKRKNDGVLFLIAPHERRVRIEVGYGLEGALTDAASSLIIHDSVLPSFRRGDLARGIVLGTHGIIGALGGGANVKAPSPATQREAPAASGFGMTGWLLAILFFFFAARHPFLASLWFLESSRMNGARFGAMGEREEEFSRGQGVSGGGGSFGGGGAGASW
jgi:uncharacterized protein